MKERWALQPIHVYIFALWDGKNITKLCVLKKNIHYRPSYRSRDTPGELLVVVVLSNATLLFCESPDRTQDEGVRKPSKKK